MKKIISWSIIIIAATILITFIAFNSSNKINDSITVSNKTLLSNNNIQEITIGMKNGNYYPNTINVKSGNIIKIKLDNSVRGCYRSFNINDLGISKYLKNSNDYVEFIAPSKGSYPFSCSMGMGYGTLIVE